MTNILYGIWNTLKSKNLAAFLILMLAVISMIGMIDPDSGIFQTWWFALVGIIFLINLVACTIQQLINGYKLWSKSKTRIKSANNIEAYDGQIHSASGDIDVSQIEKIMTGRRYKLAANFESSSIWVKGPIGIWGSPLFHIGLIVITIGALISGAMKMSGLIIVAEDEIRREIHEHYEGINEGPLFNESDHKGFGITLEKQHITVDENGDVKDIESAVAILEEGQVVRREVLGEKEPFIYNGVRIFKREPGFAPRIEVRESGNSPVVNTYVLLRNEKKGDNIEVEKTRFQLNGFPIIGSPYYVNIEFFPDMVRQGNKVTTKRYTVTNPGAIVTVFNEKAKVEEKVIKQGESVTFGEYTLILGDVKHWNGFEIVNDRGATYVFAGSWLALAGLSMLYLMPYKKVQVSYNSDIQVIGLTNRSRKMFEEELLKIKEDLLNTNT